MLLNVGVVAPRTRHDPTVEHLPPPYPGCSPRFPTERPDRRARSRHDGTRPYRRRPSCTRPWLRARDRESRRGMRGSLGSRFRGRSARSRRARNRRAVPSRAGQRHRWATAVNGVPVPESPSAVCASHDWGHLLSATLNEPRASPRGHKFLGQRSRSIPGLAFPGFGVAPPRWPWNLHHEASVVGGGHHHCWVASRWAVLWTSRVSCPATTVPDEDEGSQGGGR